MKSKGYASKNDSGFTSSRAGSNAQGKESGLGSAPDTDRQRFEEQFAELTRHRRESDNAEKLTKTEAILKKLEEKNDGKVFHSAFYN